YQPVASGSPHSIHASLHGAHARLCQAEEELNLLQHTVDGWSAWPIIRFEISLILAGLTFDHRSVVTYATRIRQAIQDLPRLARVGPARQLIQTYSSGLIERDG